MEIIATAELTPAQTQSVYCLWNKVYPRTISYREITDFELYLGALTHKFHYLLIDDQSEIYGWCFTFERAGEHWFAILIDESSQGKGYGRALLNLVKEQQPRLNGWVIDHDKAIKPNGDPYRSPLGFYLNNNFVVLADTRLETEQISAVKIVWER